MTTESVGRSVLQALADSDIVTLRLIDFHSNEEWFAGTVKLAEGESSSFEALITIVSRQPQLTKLDLSYNELPWTQ